MGKTACHYSGDEVRSDCLVTICNIYYYGDKQPDILIYSNARIKICGSPFFFLSPTRAARVARRL